MSERMKAQATANRKAAKELRDNNKDDAAQRLETRADELESGRVTDVTDNATSLISWAFRR